jgi:anthraniloyl-CoA monooxygenase
MAAVRDSFVSAARRADELGVAVLELDLAHGYLLASFLSPLTSPDGDRLRFPLAVVAAVREAWPRCLAARLSVTDWHPRGNTVEDGIAIARALSEAGVDLIHVEAGQTVHDDRPEYRRGFLTSLSDRVRNEAQVATLVGGHLTTVDEANTIVGAGRADLVVLDPPTSPLDAELAEAGNRLSVGEVARS